MWGGGGGSHSFSRGVSTGHATFAGWHIPCHLRQWPRNRTHDTTLLQGRWKPSCQFSGPGYQARLCGETMRGHVPFTSKTLLCKGLAALQVVGLPTPHIKKGRPGQGGNTDNPFISRLVAISPWQNWAMTLSHA